MKPLISFCNIISSHWGLLCKFWWETECKMKQKRCGQISNEWLSNVLKNIFMFFKSFLRILCVRPILNQITLLQKVLKRGQIIIIHIHGIWWPHMFMEYYDFYFSLYHAYFGVLLCDTYKFIFVQGLNLKNI